MLVESVQTLPHRLPLPGPESRLLDSFLATFSPRLKAGERLTIFREPRIESGFPDLVLVLWTPDGATKTNLFSTLSRAAVKLLHYLHLVGPTPTEVLVRDRGKRALTLLNLLKRSSLVSETSRGWHAGSFRRRFRVREIVAIEAKISNWSSALRQAQLNTWFASRSYILVPGLPKSPAFVEAARRDNVGILVQSERPVVTLPAPRQSLPGSYVSWMLATWTLENCN